MAPLTSRRGALSSAALRVNGILPRADGPPLGALTALLNSRAVDFAFRRGAAPLQNGFFTANKQFIAWLPVPDKLSDELAVAGDRLHDVAARAQAERAGFLHWLGSIAGTRLHGLAGATKLGSYADTGPEAVLGVLDLNASRLKVDPRKRVEREHITTETHASAARVRQLRGELARVEHAVDAIVYDAYGLSAAQQRRIEAEYV